jgi:hypothetical protein
MAAVHLCKPLAGFCYTQLTDTFLEKNGLLTADRIPKAPIAALAAATRGADAILHDWYVDPLGHSARWRARRGADFLLDQIGSEAGAGVLSDPVTPLPATRTRRRAA